MKIIFLLSVLIASLVVVIDGVTLDEDVIQCLLENSLFIAPFGILGCDIDIDVLVRYVCTSRII